MIIRDIADTPRTRVIDGSLRAELLHPDRVPGAQRLRCSVAHAIVPPGEATLPHVLKNSSTLCYILEGCGEIHIGSRSAQVSPGQIVLIPRGRTQYLCNTGDSDLAYLCIVSPKWQEADQELADVRPARTVTAAGKESPKGPAERRPPAGKVPAERRAGVSYPLIPRERP